MFDRIPRKMSPYIDFIKKNDIETVWRIRVDETFVLASKNSEYADPYGLEEILEKLEALIDAIEKYRA
jgi:hypothetical protein